MTVNILGRQFRPDRIVLPQDRKAVLILKNHDSELHAFVPQDLFVDARVPRYDRAGWLVVCIDGVVAWVPGVRIAWTPGREGECSGRMVRVRRLPG